MSLTKLLKAIEKGDQGAVKTLLVKGTSASLGEQPQGPATSSYDGGVPLVWALERGHLDIAELLLEAGADPHERQGNVSPLRVAFESSQLADRRATIDLLRKHGASLDSQQWNDSTLLGQYAEEGDIEKVQLLLEMGASVAPKGIPVQPFQKACEGKRADLCNLFLDRGVSPLAGNEGAQELLSSAIYSQLDAVAERLLTMGASPTVGGENGPPIRCAVMTGSVHWVTRLLELGASLAWKSEDGEDLLTVAVQYGHESITCFLLDKGLKPTVETLKSPVANGHFGVARALLARLQPASDAALNLMNRAVAQHHLEIAALLLPHVPDLNVFGVDAWGTPWEGKYRGGLSPLFTAVVAGQLDFAKTLVARGASTELTLPRDAQSDRYSELKLPAGATLLKAADLARVFAAKEHRDRKPFEAVKEWLSKQQGGNKATTATKASTSKKPAAEKPKIAASKGRKKV